MEVTASFQCSQTYILESVNHAHVSFILLDTIAPRFLLVNPLKLQPQPRLPQLHFDTTRLFVNFSIYRRSSKRLTSKSGSKTRKLIRFRGSEALRKSMETNSG